MTGTPDWTTEGPINFPIHDVVEIPNPNAPTGGGPTVAYDPFSGTIGNLLGGVHVFAFPTKAILSTRQVAIIIFNETANMGGPDLTSYRFHMALSILNADRIWGPLRSKYARTASDTLPSWYNSSEKVNLQQIELVVNDAQTEEVLLEIDPTGGATNYSMRNFQSENPPHWDPNLIFDGIFGPFTGPYKYGYIWLN